jgi:malonyl CoA-acyl carrier protein transacylase
MAQGSGDRGAMIAVLAPRDAIDRVMGEDQLSLVVANKNAPRQSVLSGASAEIRRAREAFAKRQIEAIPLSVAAAFHSPFVSEARQQFSSALEEVELHAGEIPVYANTTGKAYPTNARAARELLAGQLAEPVEFVSLIENMYEAGFRTFLEVGPAAKLTGLVHAILKGKAHSAFSLDASSGSQGGVADLARSIAQLASLGHEVDLAKWAPAPASLLPAFEKKPTLTIPISGANYVKPRAAEPVVTSSKKRTPAPTTNGSGSELHTNGIHTNGSSHKNGDAHLHTPKVSPVVTQVVAHVPVSAPIAAAPVPPAPAPLQTATPVVHQGLIALQELGEQTAKLHKQFLEGQDRALQVLQSLLTGTSLAASVPVATAPASAPAYLATVPAAPARVIAPAPVAIQPPAPTKPKPVIIPTAPAKVVAAPEAAAVAQIDPRVEATLLAVVGEKTGYPTEMLEMGMEIEADLGIDSIKRVEIFSALQERLPDAPPIKAEHLGTLRTLQQVADYLRGPGGGTASPTPAAKSVVATASTVSSNQIQATLLAVVGEKTGYPTEMLEMGMEIEADLGIDSIKRVEIFSALQERLPDAPPIKAEHLGTLRTLQQVADFLGSGGPTAAPRVNAPSVLASPAPSSSLVTETLLAVVSEKTGYPTEMLEMGMEIEADLGIDSIKRVEIFSALQERLPDAPPIKAEHLGILRTLGQVAEFLSGGPETKTAAAPIPAPTAKFVSEPKPVAAAVVEHSVQPITRSLVFPVAIESAANRHPAPLRSGGEIWITKSSNPLAEELAHQLRTLGYPVQLAPAAELARRTVPAALAGLIAIAPTMGKLDGFLRDVMHVLTHVGPELRASGKSGGSAFLTVASLDGAFGFANQSGAFDPVAGGLAGFAKTAGHEWPEVRCRAIDVAPELHDVRTIATNLIAELTHEGPSEVGLSESGSIALELREVPLGQPGKPALDRGDVVVISGGARGVTAEIAVALARDCQAKLVVLGRSEAPTPEPEWLVGLSDEASIKRAILGRRSTAATPKELDYEYRKIAANREALQNLARMEAAGSKVLYRSVDVRDAAAVAETLHEVTRVVGPIRGLVHGAGVLADALIESKTIESFDLVYDTKIGGMRALLGAVPVDSLKALVLFSSSTARFGRTAQVDYAVANEILNKTACLEAKRHPSCRVISVNWGPWDGGMVTSSLKKLFASEGVGLIPLSAGADYLIGELTEVDHRATEIVIIGNEGVPAKPGPGLKPALAPMPVVFERVITLESVPVLKSHIIDGRAVLPMAITMEWLSHAAMVGHPGLSFHGVEGLRVQKGVFVESTRPATVRLHAGKATRSNGQTIVPTELRSERDGHEVVHARAEIILVDRLPEAPARPSEVRLPKYDHSTEHVYQQILFHGSQLHGLESVEGCSVQGISATVSPAPAPREWMEQPHRSAWLADPLVLDSIFQLLIVWSYERHGSGSLPCYLGSYQQYRRTFPKESLRTVATVTKDTPGLAVSDITILDAEGAVVATLTGYECVIDASLNQAFRRNGTSH